jgi:glutamate synthase (NADPH/NADH) small chain
VTGAVPVAIRGNGGVAEVEFAYVAENSTGLAETGERFTLQANQVFAAIGQTLAGAPEGLLVENGKILVEGPGRTGVPRVWAGGDCAKGGEDLTVTAVAEGRDAAMDIHAALMDA